jgi:hypothetical protein
MESLTNDEFKRRATKIEAWFFHLIGSEDTVPITEYDQAVKTGLLSSRRFLRLLDMEKPDIAEADAILEEMSRFTKYHHSWLDLASFVNAWKTQQLEQQKPSLGE